MIALNHGKIASQILIEEVALYSGIDHFPVVPRERGVEPLLQIVVDRLMVVVVDFRIKSLAAIGDRSSEQKYSDGAWRLFERNVAVAPEIWFRSAERWCGCTWDCSERRSIGRASIRSGWLASRSVGGLYTPPVRIRTNKSNVVESE